MDDLSSDQITAGKDSVSMGMVDKCLSDKITAIRNGKRTVLNPPVVKRQAVFLTDIGESSGSDVSWHFLADNAAAEMHEMTAAPGNQMLCGHTAARVVVTQDSGDKQRAVAFNCHKGEVQLIIFFKG